MVAPINAYAQSIAFNLDDGPHLGATPKASKLFFFEGVNGSVVSVNSVGMRKGMANCN